MNDNHQQDIATATVLVRQTKRGSFSMLQRRMKIGYLYADQLIKELEKNGLLGPVRSDGTREVLIQESPATVEPRAGDFI